MAEFQGELQENVNLYTPPSALNFQNQSQYYYGNWCNTYQRDQTTPVNRRRTDHGVNSAFENSNIKIIKIPSTKVGRVIGKKGFKIRELMTESQANIKVENSTGLETNITLSGSSESIEKAEKLIGELVYMYIAPSERDDNCHKATEESVNEKNSFLMINEEGFEYIDLDMLKVCREVNQIKIMENLPIIKDFYEEDPTVRNMASNVVANWHRHFDVQIQTPLADSPNLKLIPNPVSELDQAFIGHPGILSEIKTKGIEQPSLFQSQAWPVLLRGEDMIGIGQPGTGKILAFLLPALIHVNGQPISREDRKGPCVLILAPTRVIARKIYKEVKKYAHENTKAVCLYAGADRERLIQTISKGVDIVIATPGQIYDYILECHIHMTNFSYIVLNEVDKMVYMDYERHIGVLLSETRPDRQIVMTSSTWPSGAQRLAKKFMQNPIQVNVGSSNVVAVRGITQEVLVVENETKERFLINFIRSIGRNDKVIIFCEESATAEHIRSVLKSKDIVSQLLCENEAKIDRERALEQFVDGVVQILVATDLAYSLLDLRDITHVVTFNFPVKIDEYVHRVGRMCRAGVQRTALTLFTEDDGAHAGNLIKILQKANQKVPSALERMAKRVADLKMHRGGGRGYVQGRGRNYGQAY